MLPCHPCMLVVRSIQKCRGKCYARIPDGRCSWQPFDFGILLHLLYRVSTITRSVSVKSPKNSSLILAIILIQRTESILLPSSPFRLRGFCRSRGGLQFNRTFKGLFKIGNIRASLYYPGQRAAQGRKVAVWRGRSIEHIPCEDLYQTSG